MDYKMNVGNELAQAKYCHSAEDLERFCEEHNFECIRSFISQYHRPMVVGKYYDDDEVIVEFKVYPKE